MKTREIQQFYESYVRKILCKLYRVSMNITDICIAFLRLHNFQSSGIVLPFVMSIFIVSTYIHHYTVHQFSSLFSFLIIISDIFLRLLHSRTFSFFLDHLSIIPCEAAISCLKVITRLYYQKKNRLEVFVLSLLLLEETTYLYVCLYY